MSNFKTIILTMILASCGQQPVGEVQTAGSVARVASKASKALDEMLASFKKTPELKTRGVDVDEISLPLIEKDSELVVEMVGETKVVFLKGHSPREQTIKFIEDGYFTDFDDAQEASVWISDIEGALDIARDRVTDHTARSQFYHKQLAGFVSDDADSAVGLNYLILKAGDDLVSRVIVGADEVIPSDILETLRNNDVLVLKLKDAETPE